MTDHPFGVMRPMLARLLGIHSKGTNPLPSITSGSVRKFVSNAATRSDVASDCRGSMIRYRPQPDAAIHRTAAGKFAIRRSMAR